MKTFNFRIKFLPREKASYIMLRRLGYSTSVLSKVFGRSSSVLHRLLQKSFEKFRDLRKFPPHMRTLYRARQWVILMSFLTQWEAFMLGVGEEPP